MQGASCGVHQGNAWKSKKKQPLNTETESDTRGRPKVVRSACHRVLVPFYSSEFDKDIADFPYPFVHCQRTTLISARASSTRHRNRDRFNQLTLTGTRIIPFHSARLIFLCLQVVSHCHLSAFLLSSGEKITVEWALFRISAKDC